MTLVQHLKEVWDGPPWCTSVYGEFGNTYFDQCRTWWPLGKQWHRCLLKAIGLQLADTARRFCKLSYSGMWADGLKWEWNYWSAGLVEDDAHGLFWGQKGIRCRPEHYVAWRSQALQKSTRYWQQSKMAATSHDLCALWAEIHWPLHRCCWCGTTVVTQHKPEPAN